MEDDSGSTVNLCPPVVDPGQQSGDAAAAVEAKLSDALANPSCNACPINADDENDTVNWKRRLNAFNQLVYNCGAELDPKTCGLSGLDPAHFDGSSTTAAPSFIPDSNWGIFTSKVNCTGGCCDPLSSTDSTSMSWCAASYMHAGYPLDHGAMFCPQSMAYSLAVLMVHTMGYSYSNSTTGDSLAPIDLSYTFQCTQLGGPLATTPYKGKAMFTTPVTFSTANGDARFAISNLINPVLRMQVAACACPPDTHRDMVSMCSGHGFCRASQALNQTNYMQAPTDTCTCMQGWTPGGGCETPVPGSCPTTTRQVKQKDGSTTTEYFICDQHGTCNGHTTAYRCQCNTGWEGIGCTLPACPMDKDNNYCSQNGTCKFGICECSDGFTGPACGQAAGSGGGSSGNGGGNGGGGGSGSSRSSSSSATKAKLSSKGRLVGGIAVAVLVLLLGVIGVHVYHIHRARAQKQQEEDVGATTNAATNATRPARRGGTTS